MKKKGGGPLKLEDFAPELRTKSPEERESKLKAQLMALAANSKRKTPHGK
jgi:ribosomal protein L29